MGKSKMDELQEQQERLVTTFLEEMPQAPLPPYFVERVMQQITTPAPVSPQLIPPRFRLSALDVLLPAFATIFSILLYWLMQQELNELSLTLPAYVNHFGTVAFETTWLYIGIALALGELTLLLGLAWFWMEDQPLLSFER